MPNNTQTNQTELKEEGEQKSEKQNGEMRQLIEEREIEKTKKLEQQRVVDETEQISEDIVVRRRSTPCCELFLCRCYLDPEHPDEIEEIDFTPRRRCRTHIIYVSLGRMAYTDLCVPKQLCDCLTFTCAPMLCTIQ